MAESMLEKVQESASRFPTAFSQWLCATDFALNPIREVAIIGNFADKRTGALIETLWSSYRPEVVAAISASASPSPGEGPALLDNRPLLDDSPTAYVCEGLVCLQPVNDVVKFEKQLSDESPSTK
jgi:uncharacterized protein YyaL (SSP411 family)